jgi:hypothetical protein
MADIIEEILTKGKRPETFSGGLYGNAGAALGGGGTRGAGVGGLYGLAGPGSYANLARLEADEEFRMKGVNSSVPTPEFYTKKEAQDIAAQNYVDAVARYMNPNEYGVTQSEAKQILDGAKRALADLNVPRSTIESVTNRTFPEGIDASRSISGVMGPSISGAIDQGIEKGSELFGLGAERLAGLIGADEALSSALLNLPNLGATFVFSDSGKKSPIITGQTPSGTQVGVNANDPYGIADIISGIRTGDLDIYDIIGAGGRVITGGSAATSYTGDEDPNKKTGVDTGVVIDPNKIPAGDEGPAKDPNKIPAGDEGPAKDKGANVGVVSPRTVGPGLDAGPGPGPSDKIPTNRVPTLDLPSFPANKVPALTLPDFPTLSLPSDRTLTLPEFDPIETERVPTSTTTPVSTTTPADKIPGGGGGGGGGGGLPEQSASPTGGMRGVATEQAGVADITMLYDPSLSLAENMARILSKKNGQADAVDSALMYGGGIVQPTDLNNELLRIIEGR